MNTYSNKSVNRWFWLTILMLHCFGLVQFKEITLLIDIFLICFFVYNVWVRKRLNTPFNVAFSAILIGLGCSMISSYHYEHTNPYLVLYAYSFIIFVFYYFILARYAPSFKTIEVVLERLAYVMCLVYIFQFIAYQYGFSLAGEDVDNELGTGVRMRMEGSALSAFACLYGLNKYLVEHKSKYIFLITLGLIVLILMAFRTMWLAIACCIVLMNFRILKRNGKGTRQMIFLLLSAFVLYNVPVVQDKVDYMIEKQLEGEQTFDNDDYSRVRSFYYYTHDHFQDNIEYFFGSGLEGGLTPYRQKLQDLLAFHMSYVDWGLLGLSWMVGIITVVGMLIYAIKILLTKFDNEHLYIWYFFFYLMLCCITTYEFARTGNFVIEAMVLYLATPYLLKTKHGTN